MHPLSAPPHAAAIEVLWYEGGGGWNAGTSTPRARVPLVAGPPKSQSTQPWPGEPHFFSGQGFCFCRRVL